MSFADVFSSLVEAARAANELEKSRKSEDEIDRDTVVENPARDAAQARLAAALEANRALRAALADRKQKLEETERIVDIMQARVDGHAVEDPMRKALIDELQFRLQQSEPPTQRERKDANLLRRQAASLEQQILALNTANLELAEVHRQERTALAEKQNKLRILGKRERELAKNLEFLATELTAWSKQVSAGTGESPTDFFHLPGLCVEKLVGRAARREPPKPAAPPGRPSLSKAEAAPMQPTPPSQTRPPPGGQRASRPSLLQSVQQEQDRRDSR